jgi:hydrogenase maturation protease
MTGRILVAGVGNIFLGDDGFGVEVAQSLSRRQLPESLMVKDFGIRGFDLAYTLLDPWHTVIIVDALPRGEAAGTVYVVEPDPARFSGTGSADAALNPHGMDPVQVLNLAASLGTIVARVLVVGCEPLDFGDEIEGRMGLSAPVQAAVEVAANTIVDLAGRILSTKDAPGNELHSVHLETLER